VNQSQEFISDKFDAIDVPYGLIGPLRNSHIRARSALTAKTTDLQMTKKVTVEFLSTSIKDKDRKFVFY
jgi:hypothetical protein